MDQRIINLFDEYTHVPLKRDVFLQRLAKLTGSMTAALAVFIDVGSELCQAQTVANQDDRIMTERITYPGADTA